MLGTFRKQLHAWHGRRLYKSYGDGLPDQPANLTVPARWIEPHKRSRIRLGLYEKHEVAMVQKYLLPNCDTIELGSGIGVVSSAVCAKLLPDRRFVGLEGNPELVSIANDNIKRYTSDASRMIQHGVVCGKCQPDAYRKFTILPNNFHHSSTDQVSDVDATADAVEVQVAQITLSELIKEQGYDSYQLVSDVEGAELEIVQQDSSSLANCRQIIAELHHCHDDNGDIISLEMLAEMFEAQGFRQVDRSHQVFVFQR